MKSSGVSVFGKGVRRCVGFTGQGSQWVGMGRDVLGKVEEAGKRLREVEGVLGIDIGHIMLSSDEVDVIGCYYYRKLFGILVTLRLPSSRIPLCFWIISVYLLVFDDTVVSVW